MITEKELTAEQQNIVSRLWETDGIAEMWEETGVFRTIDGFVSRKRLRISTYSDHPFGTLILNEDGSLWADCGAERLNLQ